jgi:hypothetical protein
MVTKNYIYSRTTGAKGENTALKAFLYDKQNQDKLI